MNKLADIENGADDDVSVILRYSHLLLKPYGIVDIFPEI